MILAQDKRTVDQDGRLHAPGCRISKANVCPYYGREIPNWQALGLEPDRIYHMYRDPAALAEAASTFENVPLTVDHIIVSADDFPADRVGGTVSNARFEHPYLVADVTAWTREAIEGIESGEQKELSCAYRYVASMIAGTSPDGVRYDGRMIGPIQANHVALVEKGRAGPDVVVADGAPHMSTKSRFLSALAAVLGTLVKPEQLAAMDSALDADLKEVKGVKHCVADEFPDLSAEDKAAAKDSAAKAKGADLSDEEEREAYSRAAKDKAAKDALPPHGPEGGAPSPNPKPPGTTAADAAIQVAVDAALVTARDGYVLAADAAAQADAARAEVHALYAAREAVAPRVGVVTLDTAEGVYRFALDKLAVPHKDVPAAALAALYEGVKAAPLATDAAPAKPVAVTELFPSLANIRR